MRSPSGISRLPKPLSGCASGSLIVCRPWLLAGFMKFTSKSTSSFSGVCTAENCPTSTSLPTWLPPTISPMPSVGLPKRPKVFGVGSSIVAKLMKFALKLPLNT